MAKETLSNEFTIFTNDGKGAKFSIQGEDLRDHFNQPSCFNTTYRSHKKAWSALRNTWSETTTMFEAMSVLEKNGVKVHSYCAVD